jgi:hypothetical protein
LAPDNPGIFLRIPFYKPRNLFTHSIEGRETLVWKIPDTVSVPKEVKGLEMSTEGLEMKGVIR